MQSSHGSSCCTLLIMHGGSEKNNCPERLAYADLRKINREGVFQKYSIDGRQGRAQEEI